MSALDLARKIALLFVLISPSMGAATFVVTNTSDSGAGSLRQAIVDANGSPGADVIAFSIPGSGIQHIAPFSQLPSLDDSAGVVIDGFSQPGASQNTLAAGDDAIQLIEIDPSDFVGLLILSQGNTIRGLRMGGGAHGCCGGIAILAGSGNRITGNLIQGHNVGVILGSPQNRVGGTQPADRNWVRGNDVGIQVIGSQASSNSIQGNFIGEVRRGFDQRNFVGVSIDLGASNNLVGGVAAGAGNVISGNETGISVQNGTATPTSDTADNHIEGNLIGTDPLGIEVLGNGFGVSVFSAVRTRIGGPVEAARNIIRGFFLYGIQVVSARENIVEGNVIESEAPGNQIPSNAATGIRLSATATDNTIRRNVIAFNGGPGLQIERNLPPPADRNSISQNSLFQNGGIGIDLGTDGVTQNDPGDLDSGANGLQNFPVLSAAVSGGGFTAVQGVLDSKPGMTFEIEIFVSSGCDPSGYGEGESFLSSTSLMTDGAGLASFAITESAAVRIGSFLTATATDPDGNTSEFSPCRVVAAGLPPGIASIPALGPTALLVLGVLLGAAGFVSLRG
jgi:hypothetical protein